MSRNRTSNLRVDEKSPRHFEHGFPSPAAHHAINARRAFGGESSRPAALEIDGIVFSSPICACTFTRVRRRVRAVTVVVVIFFVHPSLHFPEPSRAYLAARVPRARRAKSDSGSPPQLMPALPQLWPRNSGTLFSDDRGELRRAGHERKRIAREAGTNEIAAGKRGDQRDRLREIDRERQREG